MLFCFSIVFLNFSVKPKSFQDFVEQWFLTFFLDETPSKAPTNSSNPFKVIISQRRFGEGFEIKLAKCSYFTSAYIARNSLSIVYNLGKIPQSSQVQEPGPLALAIF